MTVGNGSVAPTGREVLELLANPDDNVVVSATGVEPNDRPEFFAGLMPDLSALRAKTGRPHWLIIDEAHHLMPAARDSASLALSDDRSGMIMITVHPDSVSPDALKEITAVAALGPKARDVIATVCSV